MHGSVFYIDTRCKALSRILGTNYRVFIQECYESSYEHVTHLYLLIIFLCVRSTDMFVI